MTLDRYLQRLWYGKQARVGSLVLRPLSWLFGFLVVLRRAAYRHRLLSSYRVDKPVVVIGNITVGGTGKTPFTIWLADYLQARDVRVGIVLRGYGGRSTRWPRRVDATTPWEEVGDEAALLAIRSAAIVVAGPDRVQDAREAIRLGAQVVLSDDGLQHYRLQRDVEILVIDAERGVGNGCLLPAGPLREPVGRLAGVDLAVLTRRSADLAARASDRLGAGTFVDARAHLTTAKALLTGEVQNLAAFCGRVVHAIAAIGHPEAFFSALRTCGLEVKEHAYPDHAALTREHIVFEDDAPVLMTEKDAVKCAAIADARHWVVPLQIELSAEHASIVRELVDRVLAKDAREAQAAPH